MSGKEVITLEEFLPKLRAALDARIGHEFIVVARTDARAPLGLDKAMKGIWAPMSFLWRNH